VSSKWSVAPLGELCEILDNRRKPITKSDRVSGEIPYFGASGVLDFVDDFIFDEKLVLLGEDGAKWGAGDRSAFIIEGKSWVNNHVHVLRPNRSLVTDEWLTYYLVTLDMGEFITGVTVPKLNQGRMREIMIPLPPLDEQKRIVAKLDEELRLCDEIRVLQSKKKAEVATYQNIFIDNEFRHLDCSSLSLKDAVGVIIDHRGKTPAKLGGEFTDVGVPVISAIHVKNGKIHWERRDRYVTEAMYKRWMKEPLRCGDVLLTSEAPLGQIAFVPNDDPLVLSQRLFALRGDPTILDNEFLGYYLQSVSGQQQLQGRKTGATVAGIKQSELIKVMIPIPSLERQRQVAIRIKGVISLLNQIHAVRDIRSSRLAKLQEKILSRVFGGEL
jgi:type I restriction enzyme S subunit